MKEVQNVKSKKWPYSGRHMIMSHSKLCFSVFTKMLVISDVIQRDIQAVPLISATE